MGSFKSVDTGPQAFLSVLIVYLKNCHRNFDPPKILVRTIFFIENFSPPDQFFEKSGPGLKILVQVFFFTIS